MIGLSRANAPLGSPQLSALSVARWTVLQKIYLFNRFRDRTTFFGVRSKIIKMTNFEELKVKTLPSSEGVLLVKDTGEKMCK
jgi:hypothetical protein